MKKAWLLLICVITVGGILVVSLTGTTLYYSPILQVLDENSNSTISQPNNTQTVTVKPIYDPEILSLKIHTLVNDKRLINNSTSLSWDDTISQIAKSHSDDMFQRNFFAHVNPDGLNAVDRGFVFGYEVCGDKIEGEQYFTKLNLFESKQELNNERMEQLNLRVDQYNQKSRDFEKLQDYYSTFKPSDQIAYYDLQRKASELEKERVYIETEQDSLLKIDTQLDLEYDSLNTSYQIISGKVFDGLSENLATGFLYESYAENGPITTYNWFTEDHLATIIVDGWMESPGHRENLLNPYFQTEGIGISINHDLNKLMITQDFC